MASGVFAGPRCVAVMRRRPSMESTAPRTISTPSRTWDVAPIGTRQPPPSDQSIARSAVIRLHVSASFSAATLARLTASASRHSRPIAPCPTAGSIHSASRISVIACDNPSRTSPASARMIASRPCSVSLRNRVSTFPRSSISVKSGRRFASCERRRRLLVPMIAPLGRASNVRCFVETNASPVGPRTGVAASDSPSVMIVGKSFKL